MKIEQIREIMKPNSVRSSSGRVVRLGMNFVLAAYFAVFVSDTLNLDVLYASLLGKVTFVDDAAISDSLFDSGSTHHESVFDRQAAPNKRMSLSDTKALNGINNSTRLNAVYEDEDSPGIEDAQTSGSVS